MPIDRTTENCLPLKEASRLFTSRPSQNTLLNWAGDGYRGIVLETFREGQTLCTSHEAVARFIAKMSKEG